MGAAIVVRQVRVIALLPFFQQAVPADREKGFFGRRGIFRGAGTRAAVAVRRIAVIALLGGNTDAVAADGIAAGRNAETDGAGFGEAGGSAAIENKCVPVIALFALLGNAIPAHERNGAA